MKNKAYIVANEQQEREVLGILCANGLKYVIGAYSQFRPLTGFPYVIYESNNSNVLKSGRVPKLNIYLTDVMYDGRKEEQMSDKYVVSQEFMNKLEDWKEILRLDNVLFIGRKALSNLPNLLDKWWRDGSVSVHESNNRLISILRWVNGEDVFEVENPKKWVVRSKDSDDVDQHMYLRVTYTFSINLAEAVSVGYATIFDTREEAQSWANSHQEVIQVEVKE